MSNLTELYELQQEQALPEVDGTGYLYRHKKTGARVMIIKNEDTNKVFTIGFRTPPANSKGIQHIIEHTVLCGSAKYPAKDPFVELAKGSLNTFLNAMTYSDKTVYPVASCNDKDFRNLTDVYLDAVFHPNIYAKEEIFQQEGWHYELADEEAQLIYNGVVYNEMKGVYSASDSVIARSISKYLFPDSIYRHDSGGDPKEIPALTREEYLEYHSTYYHPSNSYIYLYGNVDPEEQLTYLDREYLSQYDFLAVDSVIALQENPGTVSEAEVSFALAEGEDPSENAFLTYNAVIGTSLDKKLRVAFDVLSYCLLDAEGAPLRKALIDAGLAADVESSYDTSMYQPVFSVVAHNADADRREEFRKVLESTLQEIAANGLDKKSLKAAIHRFEFSHKEGNFGRYPKGLMLGLDAFETWLYDDSAAMELFTLNDVYAELNQAVDTDYFEQLIRTYLIENTHAVYIVGVPEVGLDAEEEKQLRDLLDEKRAALSSDEIREIVEKTAHLKEYQTEPSTKEELEKIPLLTREDLDRKVRPASNILSEIAGTELVRHSYFTSGIEYIDFWFDLSDFSGEELQLAALLAEIYKSVPTEKYSLEELTTEMNLLTGGISMSASLLPKTDSPEYLSCFMTRLKALEGELVPGIRLLQEILLHSKITDKKRLKEIIAEIYSGLRSDLTASGHMTTAQRARAYISEFYAVKEMMEGVDYYRFISGLNTSFDDRYDELVKQLTALKEKLYRRARVKISYTHKEEPAEETKKAIEEFLDSLSGEPVGAPGTRPAPEKKNEGFLTASQVQYVATAGDYRKAGLSYNGALNVLQIIFSYDYLWINVRVKGGAYGAMCDFGSNGVSFLTSYRDPNLRETFEIYKGAVDYLKTFDCSDRDMLKFIIGTLSKIDAPMPPSTEGLMNFYLYITGRTEEERQKAKNQALDADQETIRSLAPYLEALLKEETICVVGAKAKIEAEKDMFGVTENLL